MNKLKTKEAISIDVKAIADDGTFSGYCSVNDIEDSYGEVVKKGAFVDSIKSWSNKGKMPPILWQHDRNEPIGVWTKLAEDDHGLYGEGCLFIDEADVPLARKAHALMKRGAIDGLSIGYSLQKHAYNKDENVRELLTIDLKEVSVVTFPANNDSRINNVKSILEEGKIPTLPEFEKFLREAGFSKSQATVIAGHGLRKLLQGDPETKADNNDDYSEVLSILKSINE